MALALPPGAIVRHVADGRVWQLDFGRYWLAGKRPQCRIRLDDEPQVSGVHANIDVDRGVWRIVDLQSANGTRVNGTWIRSKVTPLADGDRLALGSTDLRFQLGVGPPVAESSASVADVTRLLVHSDGLAVAGDLIALATQALDGRRDRDIGLFAIDRLGTLGFHERLAPLAERAIAAVHDGAEPGLRVTATIVLGRLFAAGNADLRRTLELLTHHGDPRVRAAASESLR